MIVSQSTQLSPEPRRPLRDRCRVALTVEPISYREWNTVYDINSELVLVFEDEEEKPVKKHKRKRASLTRSLRLAHQSHLAKILDGLYVALADDESTLRSLRTFDNEPFTHIVRVSYKTPPGRDPLSLENWRRKEGSRSAGVQRLELVCPAIYRTLRAHQIALGTNQLLAARDFLTLVLPHGKDQWLPQEPHNFDLLVKQGQQETRYAVNEQDGDEDSTGLQDVYLAPDIPELDDLLDEQSSSVEVEEDKVNVLIVAPTKRAIDVMSVLLCYLSFLTDTTPDQLEVDCSDPVWGDIWPMVYVALIALWE